MATVDSTPAVPTAQGQGTLKGKLTKSMNTLKRYVSELDLEKVNSQLLIVKANFYDFEEYHEKYHATLKQDSEISASDTYFENVEDEYCTVLDSANGFIKERSSDKKLDDYKNESVNAMQCLTSQLSLPALSLETFSGDPLRYKEFMSIFDDSVHNKPLGDDVKLSRLLQFTSGTAKSAIRQCALLGGSEGYNQARKILGERFGDTYVITHKIIDDLRNGKSASSGSELQQLADDITMAHTTLKKMNTITELDNQRAIIDIIHRCPRYVKFKWQKKALNTKHDNQRYPTFAEFEAFMRRVASESVDPLYGSKNFKSSGGNSSKNDYSGSSFGAVGTSPSQATSYDRSNFSDCKLCDGKHSLFQCIKFKEKKPWERLDYVKQNRLCFLCLQSGHGSNDCEKKYRCTVEGCGKKHSKFIHTNPARTSQNNLGYGSEQDRSDHTETSDQGSSGNNNGTQTNVYLPIIPVKLPDGHIYHALLDSGSTNSFCSSNLASKLKLKPQPANIQIDTLSHSSKINKFVTCELQSCDGSNRATLNNLLVVPDIPARNPRTTINLADYPYLSDLPLDHATQHIKADLLIGNDHADLLLPLDIRSNPDGGNHPYATLSYFGWALAGPVPSGGSVNHVTSLVTSCCELENTINSMWKIETENLQKLEPSQQDKRVIDLWEKEIRIENSHYVLPIPWKDEHPDLPYNFYMAHNQLKSLYKRLDRDGIREKYDEGIQNMLDRGYAEHVPEDELNLRDGSVLYLPHHPVISESKPGKVRIVMNCAAKFHGVSLNSQVLMGPDLLNNLLHVVLRFRQYEWAVMADIEKMYLNCHVTPKDRNALRFLYHDQNDNLIHLRMKSHLYGGVWCSALATFCLRRICLDFECSHLVTDVIHQSFYVDDLARSIINEIEGSKLINDTRQALSKGSFNLTQIRTNSKVINDNLVPDIQTSENKELAVNTTSKCLGIKWDIQLDQFLYQFNLTCPNGTPITRRHVLSKVSSMYDPLGLISCTVVRGRMIFQELTRLKLLWDDEIPKQLQCKWQSWVESLISLDSINFDRCIIPKEYVGGVSELIIFSDASKLAYGAMAYIRTINKTGKIHVSLLMSKTRLLPLKGMTIPRAELCAALIGCRLECMIREQLDIDLIPTTFFTDSEIVLSYIKNEDKRFKTFVANRVAEIRDSSDPDQWFHIEGTKNPADILSRGCNGNDIPAEWFYGPSFLHDFKCNWPKSGDMPDLVNNSEVIMPKLCTNASSQKDIHPLDKLTAHYSSFYYAKKALAWLLRLKSYLVDKDARMVTGPITSSELKKCDNIFIRHVQQEHYGDEINCLRKRQRISRTSPILKLDPVLQDDILVVGGRLTESTCIRCKHPIILPHQHRISRLLAEEHHNIFHSGVEWTLSRLRLRYWIIGARNLLKSISHSCVTCKKLFGKAAEQKMSNLPSSRLEPFLPAFSNTGLDIFGNFYVKVRRSLVKRYGVVFTCFNTRAVHIEVINSLTSSDFICALIRFFSRRGRPKKIFCDNATTFVGAYNEITKTQEQLDQAKVMQFTRRLDIEWHFNTPLASHHGGVWERIIRTIRKVIAAIIPSNVNLTDDQLTTYFCEAECIINGRPLTKCSDDINDESPLTPNHFLVLGENASLPMSKFTESDIYRRRWRHVQFLINCFWKRWIRSYLPILHLRQRWPYVRDNIKIGDLVLMVDENRPRAQYPLALVSDVKKGRDNLVRSVSLRSRGKTYVRPVSKVIFLEGRDVVQITGAD